MVTKPTRCGRCRSNLRSPQQRRPVRKNS